MTCPFGLLHTAQGGFASNVFQNLGRVPKQCLWGGKLPRMRWRLLWWLLGSEVTEACIKTLKTKKLVFTSHTGNPSARWHRPATRFRGRWRARMSANGFALRRRCELHQIDWPEMSSHSKAYIPFALSPLCYQLASFRSKEIKLFWIPSSTIYLYWYISIDILIQI